MESTGNSDDFVKRLLVLLQEVIQRRKASKGEMLELGMMINRYDYFVCNSNNTPQPFRSCAVCGQYNHIRRRSCEGCGAKGNKEKSGVKVLKQVEMNTVAASFASLAGITWDMHNRFLEDGSGGEKRKMVDVGENHPVDGIVDSILFAHKLFLDRSRSEGDKTAELDESGVSNGGIKEAVVLMVTKPDEGNYIDQEILKYKCTQRSLTMIRISMLEILERCHVDEESNHLVWGNGRKVSIVYYRAGYDPAEYASEDEWRARRLVELSNAIKIPDVATQLAGMKKIQQALTSENDLVCLVENEREREMIQDCFAGQWQVDKESRIKALEAPEKFVLKPQREGGGNNLYGAELKKKLTSMKESEWNGYTLMERLRPTELQATLVRQGVAETDTVVSELGVYGVCVYEGEEIRHNSLPGTLVRTKFARQDDGGIVAGVAVLDSVRVTEDA